MPTKTDMTPPLVLTMGEPGGVGPELTEKAWTALRKSNQPFFVVSDPALFANIPVEPIEHPSQARSVFENSLPVLPLQNPISATSGVASSDNAKAVIESIDRAVNFAASSDAAGVVTNPIHKAALLQSGFSFPGHTEYLEALTNTVAMPQNRKRGAVMMIAGTQLRTVPITIHQSVKEAISSLNTPMITKTSLIAAQAMQSDFGIENPRIAISGLNPHAGEDGEMGSEERDIIEPAIAELRLAGINAIGPLSADTMFHEEARATYDVALCMLHDQALIPAKTLGFHDAVNVTLGLPIIRTSPDHGTALDIAGKGIAKADSLLAAISLAEKLVAGRQHGQS